MLNPEIAQAQLKEVLDPNCSRQRMERIAALPEPYRSIAHDLMGTNDPARSQWEYLQAHQYRTAALNQLAEVSDPTVIFDCLFPKFGAVVASGWGLFDRLPYQQSYHRRSFRVPNHPQFQSKRSAWLLALIDATTGYDHQSLEWFAAWVPYFQYYSIADYFGILFAAAIEQGNETIFQILLDSARGDHEIGAMGRHITRAFLISDRPEAWDFIERLLLAAQRQEGLRQTILEMVDEAHSIAFVRMLRLIVAEKLTRFSSVIRAIDVWFGFGLESLNEKLAKQILTQVSELLEDETAQQQALESSDAQTVYLALWTYGYRDAIAAIDIAISLFNHSEASHRFVAVHFLAQLDLAPARLALIDAIDDPDLTVATRAVQECRDENLKDSDVFERLEQNLARFSQKPKTVSIVWDWVKLESSQELVAFMMVEQLGTRSPKRLIPFLPVMDSYKRHRVVELLAAVDPWDDEIRATLFKLTGDATQWVRETAIRALHRCTITTDESIQIEQLLTRKASDLRRGVLGLLLNQSDENAIESAERLLNAKQAPQRQAGLELLRELVLGKRCVQRSRILAANYQQERSKRSTTEDQLLAAILEPETKEATLTDALGLVDIDELTPIVKPEPRSTIQFTTPAAIACLTSLDELIHEHRQTPVKTRTWESNEEEQLLGNLHSWQLYCDKNTFVLTDVWENWWQQRTPRLRDEDGLELLRMIAPRFQPATSQTTDVVEVVELDNEQQGLIDALEEIPDQLTALIRSYVPDYVPYDEIANQVERSLKTISIELPQLRYPELVNEIARWLMRQHPPEQASNFALDALAQMIQLIPTEKLRDYPRWNQYEYQGLRSRIETFLQGWIYLAQAHDHLTLEWNDDRQLWWQITRWFDRWMTFHNSITTIFSTYAAWEAGAAKEADLIFQIIGSYEEVRPQENATAATIAEAKARVRSYFNELYNLTRRKPQAEYQQLPRLNEIVDRIRARILSIELQRGDFPTAASYAARQLRSITGISTVIQLIQGLGQEKIVRGYSYGSLSKASVFSHLMRVSFPAPQDTPEEFKQRVISAQIPTQKLIQFAFYAPQWVNYVEYALGWSGFADAVWWIHAHTKDTSWSVEEEVRETWEAQISERTPLSTRSLMDGAVDVSWFLSLRKRLKPERWQQLYDSAQFASSGSGHQRAKLFADAMLGNLQIEAVRDRINEKRHQDSVRAIGLLPLPKGKKREKELLDRYTLLQEFLRSSKKFGSQRQASEKLAVSIGLENLARTAGYIDPQRLQWAMEASLVADLAGQAQTIAINDVSVSLSINELGEPEIAISKAGKALKSIPAKLKKDPQIQALTNRKQDITKQASRMRISLEQAMCRGDRFTVDELMQLRTHPVLAPMLSQLILVSDQDIGYLTETGLRSHNGTIQPIQADSLRIAHPYDLLQSNEWHLWQQDCFERSRSQPFKQVFRELYVLTAQEQSEKLSKRYEGHQVNSKQAIALFGQRGWVATPDEGVRRTFHTEGVIAAVELQYGYYTPLEVEGLTLEGVRFYRRDEWKPLPLVEVPPMLLSEVLRDLDLVVSVAHQGGVDPEATASTVEMRSSLVRETCRLLKLPNVHIQSNHVLIEGHLGSYSVHLGSAMVHRQPGGALCIIPVPSQHRGRIFLPFVDNDPKTAEVISKVVLLAKDKEIQDPTILEQIL
ncbi:DUF4132 domain-containing protein [Leptolyngbya sp. NIES-2104]|uniref:DUF4132 domain-containing protein n=1 Tax=Leptolyngbya sp. NIES-2104 TaxID=1552121 RepID=UPI0006EC50CE|nr:DUF4132 domain-containing protein [Leptolyngbya sp. NIES-2104]GAP98110.1 hypothetical protein NIES2104_46630 [Leptolyngbya sp. NIES-2104]